MKIRHPFSAMNSRICAFVTLLKKGQQRISFDVFRKVWGVCRSIFSYDSLAHGIKRSPDIRVFMVFGSPALLIMVLCTTNGERE